MLASDIEAEKDFNLKAKVIFFSLRKDLLKDGELKKTTIRKGAKN